MGHHDQFFKRLFETFFGDLIRLVVPELAAALDVDNPAFKPTEGFTDLVTGDRRQSDLLASVAPRDGHSPDGTVESPWGEDAHVGFHVEAQDKNTRTVNPRTFVYNLLSQLRLQQLAVSIVVLRTGGDTSLEKRVVRGILYGIEMMNLTTFAFSLGRSDARTYLAGDVPLGWGLAALMRRGSWSRAEHKLECLRAISTASLSEYEKYLLAHCVEKYLQLDGEDAMELARLLEDDTDREEIEDTGFALGNRLKAEGRAEGIAEGKAEGRLEAWRQILLDVLMTRFSPLPAHIEQQVTAMESEHQLRRLARQALNAKALTELDLG